MDPKGYQQLGSRIARHRDQAGLTQEQLAERARISPPYLNRIESGTRRPTLDVVHKIAAGLGIPIARLFADERASRAAEGYEGWGKPARQLAALIVELSDEDVELLLGVAQRLLDR